MGENDFDNGDGRGSFGKLSFLPRKKGFKELLPKEKVAKRKGTSQGRQSFMVRRLRLPAAESAAVFRITRNGRGEAVIHDGLKLPIFMEELS